ncbi:hypothetical protein VP01_116g1 [Puccinia sorghi]|uniref:Uncharacterized protein n=1 Tax=Puccinia sorghi TaxID=27349 RepID=A0A0L6VR92_9BASI|nr:hypothetical protein VP01_116g1 [Puccinia sorghi]
MDKMSFEKIFLCSSTLGEGTLSIGEAYKVSHFFCSRPFGSKIFCLDRNIAKVILHVFIFSHSMKLMCISHGFKRWLFIQEGGMVFSLFFKNILIPNPSQTGNETLTMLESTSSCETGLNFQEHCCTVLPSSPSSHQGSMNPEHETYSLTYLIKFFSYLLICANLFIIINASYYLQCILVLSSLSCLNSKSSLIFFFSFLNQILTCLYIDYIFRLDTSNLNIDSSPYFILCFLDFKPRDSKAQIFNIDLSFMNDKIFILSKCSARSWRSQISEAKSGPEMGASQCLCTFYSNYLPLINIILSRYLFPQIGFHFPFFVCVFLYIFQGIESVYLTGWKMWAIHSNFFFLDWLDIIRGIKFMPRSSGELHKDSKELDTIADQMIVLRLTGHGERQEFSRKADMRPQEQERNIICSWPIPASLIQAWCFLGHGCMRFSVSIMARGNMFWVNPWQVLEGGYKIITLFLLCVSGCFFTSHFILKKRLVLLSKYSILPSMLPHFPSFLFPLSSLIFCSSVYPCFSPSVWFLVQYQFNQVSLEIHPPPTHLMQWLVEIQAAVNHVIKTTAKVWLANKLPVDAEWWLLNFFFFFHSFYLHSQFDHNLKKEYQGQKMLTIADMICDHFKTKNKSLSMNKLILLMILHSILEFKYNFKKNWMSKRYIRFI